MSRYPGIVVWYNGLSNGILYPEGGTMEQTIEWAGPVAHEPESYRGHMIDAALDGEHWIPLVDGDDVESTKTFRFRAQAIERAKQRVNRIEGPVEVVRRELASDDAYFEKLRDMIRGEA